MVTIVKMASVLIILLEYLYLKKIDITMAKDKGIIRYIAGYMKKASSNRPSIIRLIERCKPQPRHSKPKNFLFKHGSIKSSNKAIY